MRAALLVIDMINGSFGAGEASHTSERLVRNINELIRGLREAGSPILWVRQEFAEDLHDAFLEMRERHIRKYVRGTRDCEFVAGLDVRPSDAVIVKKRYSAFFGTDLDSRLASAPPSHLVLAGVNTHACVRTTAIDAYQRDWRLILASDCVASYDDEHHRVSLAYLTGKICQTLPNGEILARVRGEAG